MKEKSKTILGRVIIGAMLLFILISGIYDLLNVNDRQTVNITYGTEVLAVEHSIGGIIPVGKDYYYLGIDEKTQNAYILHAPKNWCEKNSLGSSNSNSVQVTALAKRISKYQISKEIYARTNDIQGIHFPLGTENCLEVSYVKDSWMKIGSVVFLLVLIILGFTFKKKKDEVSPAHRKIYLILLVIALILMLISIV